MDAVRGVLNRSKDEILSLLAKGETVLQFPWTNASIAFKLQKLTGITFVASSWPTYNHSFLYSLALAAEVDMNVTLTEKQAEAAFALASVWKAPHV